MQNMPWLTKIRIPQTMVSGIPLVLILRIVVMWSLGPVMWSFLAGS